MDNTETVTFGIVENPDQAHPNLGACSQNIFMSEDQKLSGEIILNPGLRLTVLTERLSEYY
jgi:hypothetical protein